MLHHEYTTVKQKGTPRSAMAPRKASKNALEDNNPDSKSEEQMTMSRATTRSTASSPRHFAECWKGWGPLLLRDCYKNPLLLLLLVLLQQSQELQNQHQLPDKAKLAHLLCPWQSCIILKVSHCLLLLCLLVFHRQCSLLLVFKMVVANSLAAAYSVTAINTAGTMDDTSTLGGTNQGNAKAMRMLLFSFLQLYWNHKNFLL